MLCFPTGDGDRKVCVDPQAVVAIAEQKRYGPCGNVTVLTLQGGEQLQLCDPKRTIARQIEAARTPTPPAAKGGRR